jgi:phosphatidate cytidylyltransferase
MDRESGVLGGLQMPHLKNNTGLRIVTTTVLLSILLGIFWLHHYGVVLGALTLLWFVAFSEWTHLFLKRSLPVFALLGVLIGGGVLYTASGPLLWGMSIAAMVLWLGLSVWVWAYERKAFDWKPHSILMIVALGYCILLPVFIGLAALYAQEQGRLFILLLVFVVSGSDVAAYFGGRCWGKHLLAPRVSPGKTCEGVMVALVVVGGLSLGVTYVLWPQEKWLLWIIMVTVTVFMGVIGDLFESMMKRLCGVKDSGRILPGHGGVLDRLDSLCAATPFFITFLMGFGFIGERMI